MKEIPSVLFLGQKNFISDGLNDLLIQKKCQTLFSVASNFKSLKKDVGFANLSKIDYIIFVFYSSFLFTPGYFQVNCDRQREKLILDLGKKIKAKVLVIYSYTRREDLGEKIENDINILLKELTTRMSVIYVGDVIQNVYQKNEKGSRVIFEQLIETCSSGIKLNLPKSYYLYPITEEKTYSSIAKILFSIGFYNLKIALLGKPLRPNQIQKTLSISEKSPTLLLSKNFSLSKPPVDEIKYFDCKKETREYFKSVNAFTRLQTASNIQLRKALPVFRKKLHLLILTIVFILFPFWSLPVTSGLLNLSEVFFENGKITQSGIFSKISFNLLIISKTLNYGPPFLNESRAFLQKKAEVLIKLNFIANSTYEIYKNLISENQVLPDDFYQEVSRNLQVVYEDLGQLQNDMSGQENFLGKVVISKKESEKLLLLKKEVENLIVLSRNLPNLLGEKEVKKYLIMLENPNLLMPGGGKIEKMYLVTISKGKVVNEELVDLGLGKSKVFEVTKIPKPYNQFLQGGWYLENANIYPDFTKSSNKVLFFADKQQDIESDGIISLNSPIFLSAKNPTKKSRFYYEIRSVISDLQKNNIQIFFKNENFEKAIANFGWDGSIKTPSCINSCYSDILNYFELSLNEQSEVSREINLQISLEEKIIKRKMSIFLENKGDKNYAGYINVLVPDNSGFSPTTVSDKKEEKIPDVNISGFDGFKTQSLFIEIPASSSKTIFLSWESGTNTGVKNLDEYALSVGRQGGINNLSINVNFITSKRYVNQINAGFTLTQSGNLVYNAHLQEDKTLRIFFK
jgi:hypothetical protein